MAADRLDGVAHSFKLEQDHKRELDNKHKWAMGEAYVTRGQLNRRPNKIDPGFQRLHRREIEFQQNKAAKVMKISRKNVSGLDDDINTSDSSAEEDVKEASAAPEPDAGITYSFDAPQGTYSVFNSQETPTTPMRPPSPQKSLFSQAKPAQEFRTPSFTHLRETPNLDFSSGPDNHSSPDNADNEDTPEPPSKAHSNTAITLFKGEHKSPSKSSFSDIFGNHTSPGRGEIPKRHYTDAIARRIHKRRRRDHEKDSRLAHRRPSYDSDSESRSRPHSSDGTRNSTQHSHPQTHSIGFVPSLFTFIETHPRLPHILSYYVQLTLNVFLVFFFMYLLYSFWATIRSDVDIKSSEAAASMLAEMGACARNFVDNRCDRESRVPAMEVVCDNWEKCMQRDPSKVARAAVSAHTFAEIFNGFIEPISYKAMIFTLTLIFGGFAISNFAFGFFRNKAHPPPPSDPFPTPASYMDSHPQSHQPSTPFRQQQHMNFPPNEHFYTPYQNRAAGMGAFGGMDAGTGTGQMGLETGMPSPGKRIGYR
ncbi:hypothetical protein MMC06_002653 [Schaereria dolodes]|nr:hypothetical protein [Schaereria dolodes]